MEISSEMKRYILVAIAGIAIAAYIVPTSGWINLNTAFAGSYGGNGDSECEGGDGGDARAIISQEVEQNGGDDEYGNTATVSNEGDATAIGGNGGECGNGGDATAVISQSVLQTNIGGGSNTATVTNTGDATAIGGDGDGGGGDATAVISQRVVQSNIGGGSSTNENTAEINNEGDASAIGGDGDASGSISQSIEQSNVG